MRSSLKQLINDNPARLRSEADLEQWHLTHFGPVPYCEIQPDQLRDYCCEIFDCIQHYKAGLIAIYSEEVAQCINQ